MMERLRKHTRAARIQADDGEHKVKITLEFVSNNGLVLDEVREVRTRLARRLVDDIRDLKWTDFGPDNTKVTLLRRL